MSTTEQCSSVCIWSCTDERHTCAVPAAVLVTVTPPGAGDCSPPTYANIVTLEQAVSCNPHVLYPVYPVRGRQQFGSPIICIIVSNGSNTWPGWWQQTAGRGGAGAAGRRRGLQGSRAESWRHQDREQNTNTACIRLQTLLTRCSSVTAHPGTSAAVQCMVRQHPNMVTLSFSVQAFKPATSHSSICGLCCIAIFKFKTISIFYLATNKRH